MRATHRTPQENALLMGNRMLKQVEQGHVYLINYRYRLTDAWRVIHLYYQADVNKRDLKEALGFRERYDDYKRRQFQEFLVANYTRALPDAPRTDAALWSLPDDGTFTEVLFDETGNLNFYGPRDRTKTPHIHTGPLYAKRVPDLIGGPMLYEAAFPYLPGKEMIVLSGDKARYETRRDVLSAFMQACRGVVRIRVRVRPDYATTLPKEQKIPAAKWRQIRSLRRTEDETDNGS